MQRGFEKDYHELLLSLIPRDLLSSVRLEGIIDALAHNERSTMIKEAYLSMEELCAKGVFIKKGFRKSGDGVFFDYEGAGDQTRFTLEMTKIEWGQIPPERMVDERKEIVPGVIAGIISSLSINSARSVGSKISSMLSLSPRIVANTKAFLILDTRLNILGTHSVTNIFEISFDNIKKNQLYRRVLQNKAVIFVSELLGMKKSFFELSGDVKRLVLIPLIFSDREIGVLEIHFSSDVEISKNILFNLSLVGEGIIRLLKNNIQLEQMVSVDKLTCVNNRNYYETQVPLELERASRDKKFLGFLIMDIDHFKEFNDKYGHDTGDEVLKLVAQTVKRHLRKIDLFIRFGGEEFIAVLPGASKEAAMRTAERLRNVIENTEYKVEDGRELSITISIGGSIFPLDAKNQSELFRNADKSLLKAKRNGRNKVVFF